MSPVQLPWRRMWRVLWRAIPDPLTYGRSLLARDDSVNPKIETGHNVFARQSTLDHAVKRDRSAPLCVDAGDRDGGVPQARGRALKLLPQWPSRSSCAA